MAIVEAPPLRLRSPPCPDRAGPVTASVVVHLLLIAAYLAAFDGDVSALVCADAGRIGQFPYEHVGTGFGTHGFDGQYYYALARDPWHADGTGLVELPAYRHGRILYLALAWLLSGGGDPVLLLWALPAINLAAIGGLAWLGVAVAIHYGRSPWWGAMLPIVLNVGAAALRDLTDPLAALAVAGLLVAWLLGWRSWLLTAWAIAAVLSREQNVAVVGVVLLGCLTRRRWWVAAGLAGVVGLWLGWVAVLHGMYGTLPFTPDNVAAPLAGMTWRWTHLNGQVGAGRLPIHAIAMSFLTLQIALALLLPYFRAERTVALTALGGAALALLAGPAIFENGQSYTRVFLWMPLAIWLWAVQTGRRWPIALLSPAALWPLFALVQVWRPA